MHRYIPICVGRIYKKYDPFGSIRLWAVGAIIIAMNLIVIGNFYIVTAGNILVYNSENGSIFIQSIPTYYNNQIVPIILAIAVFELFRRIKVPNNDIVNFVGASTFMVYLIHDNEFFYKVWNIQDWITLLYENEVQFVLTFIACVLKTFAVGVLCYCLFEVCGRLWNVFKPLALKKSVLTSKER